MGEIRNIKKELIELTHAKSLETVKSEHYKTQVSKQKVTSLILVLLIIFLHILQYYKHTHQREEVSTNIKKNAFVDNFEKVDKKLGKSSFDF